jgi:hypothetical protein
MNREKAAELWPILKAYAEGAEIEYRGTAASSSVWPDTWTGVKGPTFQPDLEYRIKPKPREVWVNFYESRLPATYRTEAAARETATPTALAVAVHMREVIEEKT